MILKWSVGCEIWTCPIFWSRILLQLWNCLDSSLYHLNKSYFLRPFFLLSYFHFFLYPSFLGLSITKVSTSPFGQTSVLEILLSVPISSVWILCLCHSEKDSYSLFPVDGVLFQWHFLKNQSRKSRIMQTLFYCSWKIIGVRWDWTPRWKQFTKRTLYLWVSRPRLLKNLK